jgi:hypothetical protein
MILRVLIFSVSTIFSGCGDKTETSDLSDASTTATTTSSTTSNNTSNAEASNSDSKKNLGCSEDGSETLVPGTYIFALSSSVSSKQKNQVKILKSDCTYCFETVTEGDASELSKDGTWTSNLGTKDTNGQQIEVTAGGTVYSLSGDGQTLSQSSAIWSKSTYSFYTCN